MGKKNYGSVYGAPYKRYRYLLKYLDDYYKRKVKILIPNKNIDKLFVKE